MPGPLEGRRIWFVGIGGAGLSSYALLARARGAEIGGWDRNETPYLAALAGVELEIGHEPATREGWEVVVSTAFRGQVAGKTRAEFLAELVSLQPAIVVAGAHGKTTTAAMIAFVLAELGHDPAWLIGGEVPQLGSNAGTGSGWLVVEGDESDRTIAALRPELAVVTNVDLDHHSEFRSRAELEALFEEWLLHVPTVVRGAALEPVSFELSVPGEHNRQNAAVALAALECAGVVRSEAKRVLREFRGAGRRLELRGVAADVEVFDSYAHHPAEIAADLAALRNGGRLLALFQPHLFSRTRYLAREFAAALAAGDAVAVTDVYAARENRVPGVSGKLVVDALAELRPGAPVGWLPNLADAARFVSRRARAGDRVLTLGAGDVDRAAALILAELA